jgi:hypothetical protein
MASWTVVWDGGASIVVLLSVQCVQMNASIQPLATVFPGSYTGAVCRLGLAEGYLQWWWLSGC